VIATGVGVAGVEGVEGGVDGVPVEVDAIVTFSAAEAV